MKPLKLTILVSVISLFNASCGIKKQDEANFVSAQSIAAEEAIKSSIKKEVGPFKVLVENLSSGFKFIFKQLTLSGKLDLGEDTKIFFSGDGIQKIFEAALNFKNGNMSVAQDKFSYLSTVKLGQLQGEFFESTPLTFQLKIDGILVDKKIESFSLYFQTGEESFKIAEKVDGKTNFLAKNFIQFISKMIGQDFSFHCNDLTITLDMANQQITVNTLEGLNLTIEGKYLVKTSPFKLVIQDRKVELVERKLTVTVQDINESFEEVILILNLDSNQNQLNLNHQHRGSSINVNANWEN